VADARRRQVDRAMAGVDEAEAKLLFFADVIEVLTVPAD
jgi:hypothetical protein